MLETSFGRPRMALSAKSAPPVGSAHEYARRYADQMGWRVFPVHGISADGKCTCGNPACSNPGKHPVRELVHDGLRSASSNPAVIDAWWTNAPWAGIAVATGRDSSTWVVDVDTAGDKQGDQTLEALEATHGKLPPTVEAISGSGGRHVWFAYPHDVKIGSNTSKLGAGIDIRGDGGYIIVEPSRHVSGNAYAWEGSSDPLEGVPLAAAPQWLLDMVARPRAGSAPALNVLPGMMEDSEPQTLSERDMTEIKQALGYIPAKDYDPWIAVGMALHSTGAHEQAFELWDNWSRSANNYDGGAMRRKWASFHDSAGGVGLGTLFQMAQEQGWSNPARLGERPAASPLAGLDMSALEQLQPTHAIKDPAPGAVPPFPVPGLQDMCTWMESEAPISYPLVTQQAALCLAATAASRRYVTPFGDPLALYLGAAARSIGEIRYIHHALFTALSAAGLRRMVRTTRFTSPQTIYRSLIRSPACLYLSDDFGRLSAFARRQPSGLQEQALSVLSAVYDGRALQLDNPEDAGLKASTVGDAQPVIESPALSICALLGQTQLTSLLSSEEVGRGSLEQILIACSDDSDSVLRDPQPTPIPAWIPAHLQTIRQVSSPGAQLDLDSIFQGNAELRPRTHEVPFCVPVDPYYEPLTGLSSDPRLQPLLIAARGIIRRIAAVLAVWESPEAPRVEEHIIAWSAEYVRARMETLVSWYDRANGDGHKASVYDMVLARVLEAKRTGLPRRDLTIRCRAFRALESKKRSELIEQMLDDETLFEITIMGDKGKGRRSKPRKVLVASQFVRPA